MRSTVRLAASAWSSPASAAELSPPCLWYQFDSNCSSGSRGGWTTKCSCCWRTAVKRSVLLASLRFIWASVSARCESAYSFSYTVKCLFSVDVSQRWDIDLVLVHPPHQYPAAVAQRRLVDWKRHIETRVVVFFLFFFVCFFTSFFGNVKVNIIMETRQLSKSSSCGIDPRKSVLFSSLSLQ